MAYLKDCLSDEVLAGYFENADELESELKKAVRAGDVVMAKASKGLKFSPMVENLINHFGERAP